MAVLGTILMLSAGAATAMEVVEDAGEERINDSLYEEIDHI
jgi:hypothetical protein